MLPEKEFELGYKAVKEARDKFLAEIKNFEKYCLKYAMKEEEKRKLKERMIEEQKEAEKLFEEYMKRDLLVEALRKLDSSFSSLAVKPETGSAFEQGVQGVAEMDQYFLKRFKTHRNALRWTRWIMIIVFFFKSPKKQANLCA